MTNLPSAGERGSISEDSTTGQVTPEDQQPEEKPARHSSRGTVVLISGLLAAALGGAALALPVPYVVESPGPTFNTLGQDGSNDVIRITGHETYRAKGNLDLTTVYVEGGPNSTVNLFGAFQAWLDGSKAVYPEELLYPKGTTPERSQQESAQAMATSQENATAAALQELKIPFGQKLQINSLADGSPAEGKLQAGDVFVSVNGKPVTALSIVQRELAAGAGEPATVVVERAGSPVTVKVTPTKNQAGRYVLGVLLQYQFNFPFDVKISLEKVGGPSAGMMFALGIVDSLTPGDLTGGKHIAGTGTITPEGAVGSIGGVAQKMVGARRSGATMFLAPAANCDEVVGHVPDGLQVVKVETLADAKAAVEKISSGQDTSSLPTCTAAQTGH
ncbi:PDZ domain-containing protein [Arthrobacter sp. M4]|uniref:YlbL family protein n=1 Tax=Arthrobacter sp. M4 TaxID=218160 RepID=UPI0035AC0D93